MTTFVNGFKTAKFINPPKNTLIEIIYESNNKDSSYLIDVDHEHPDFKALMELVSLEDIEKATYNKPTVHISESIPIAKISKESIKNIEIINNTAEIIEIVPDEAPVKPAYIPRQKKNRQVEVQAVNDAIQMLMDNRYDEGIIFPLKVKLFKNEKIINSGLKRDIEESKDLMHLVSIMQYLD